MYKTVMQISIFASLFMFSVTCNANQLENNKYLDGITLTITNKPFDSKTHKIDRCEGSPCMIDGVIFYGGEGDLPKTEVESLIFSQNGKKIYLDVSAIYDTGVTNKNIKQHISVESWLGPNSYRVVGYFGGDKKNKIEPFIALWLVLPNGSVRNYIGYYESLVSLLFKVKQDFKLNK